MEYFIVVEYLIFWRPKMLAKYTIPTSIHAHAGVEIQTPQPSVNAKCLTNSHAHQHHIAPITSKITVLLILKYHFFMWFGTTILLYCSTDFNIPIKNYRKRTCHKSNERTTFIFAFHFPCSAFFFTTMINRVRLVFFQRTYGKSVFFSILILHRTFFISENYRVVVS